MCPAKIKPMMVFTHGYIIRCVQCCKSMMASLIYQSDETDATHTIVLRDINNAELSSITSDYMHFFVFDMGEEYEPCKCIQEHTEPIFHDLNGSIYDGFSYEKLCSLSDVVITVPAWIIGSKIYADHKYSKKFLNTYRLFENKRFVV